MLVIYEACADSQKNVVKCGKTKAGRQRSRAVTRSPKPIFYRRRTPADEIIETLALRESDQ